VKTFCVAAALLGLTSPLFGQSIVDNESPLETLATEFGLADGPAWDGSWALYFPDVKGETLYRYIPKQKKVVPVLKDAGRISASFFNHGRLFLSDNANGHISEFKDGKKVALTQPEGEGKSLARPNDLVVDDQGGIYFTLTRENRVMYRRFDGKLIVAVPEVVSPNGITQFETTERQRVGHCSRRWTTARHSGRTG
jgi:gluconolactonase